MTKEKFIIKLLSIIYEWDESTSINECKTDVRNLIEQEEKLDEKDDTSRMTPYELGKHDSIRSVRIGETRFNNPFPRDTDEWFNYNKGLESMPY